MPITERRKISRTKLGDSILRLPKGWARMFGYPEEVELIIDTPVVAFPPSVKSNADRVDALKKIIRIIEASPESPYPEAKRRKKK